LGFEFCVVLSRPRYWQPIPNDNADSRGTTKIKARGGRVALPRDRRGMSGARPLRGTLWLDVTRASPPQQLAATQNAKPKTQKLASEKVTQRSEQSVRETLIAIRLLSGVAELPTLMDRTGMGRNYGLREHNLVRGPCRDASVRRQTI
jgi:hypothetical protein